MSLGWKLTTLTFFEHSQSLL